MKTLAFLNRNIKEIIRDPLSIVFLLVIPSLLFIILESIMISLNIDLNTVPQFKIEAMVSGMIVFSFSFASIFLGNIIANDRESCFLLRLKATPMKSHNFILGYTLVMLPFTLIQEIIMAFIGIILGLKLTLNVLLSMLIIWPLSLLFIGCGIIFGICFNSRSVGGISSILPMATSLLGGIFFPLDLIEGPFKTICYIFPFANAINIEKNIIYNNFDILLNLVVVIIYIVVIYSVSIFVFDYRLKHDSI